MTIIDKINYLKENSHLKHLDDDIILKSISISNELLNSGFKEIDVYPTIDKELCIIAYRITSEGEYACFEFKLNKNGNCIFLQRIQNHDYIEMSLFNMEIIINLIKGLDRGYYEVKK